MKFEKISVIGLGYIGLPTAAMFASCGANVVGVDVSSAAVETINRGGIHIVEPSLEDIVRKSVENGKLKAVYKPEPADAFLIAVPTPFKKDNLDAPEPDLSFIEAACVAIAPVLKKGNLVVLESTSPVGATEKVSQWLSELRPDLILPRNHDCNSDIFVAHCPERVLPGRIIHELVHNDRIIGGITPKCSQAAKSLYEMFVIAECHITNARTAEMAKLTENASRDVQIAFANELSLICDEQNINVWELITLANKHPRVNILQPGPGVGGHCIAVDPWFICHTDPTNSKLIKAAREINDNKPLIVSKKIIDELNRIGKRRIILFGATYKENIDDLRESPNVKIGMQLKNKNICDVVFFEPNIADEKIHDLKNITSDDIDTTNDLCVFLVKHHQFFSLNLRPKYYIDIVGFFGDTNR